VEEMRQAAKTRPGQLSITTTGIGSDTTWQSWTCNAAGLRFNIVHFGQGTAEALKPAWGPRRHRLR